MQKYNSVFNCKFKQVLINTEFNKLFHKIIFQLNVSDSGEQIEETLNELDNLIGTHFRLAVHSVHKTDGHFSYLIAQTVSSDHHFHLKYVSFADTTLHQLFQHLSLVEPKAAGQVRDSGSKHHLSQIVGAS